MNTNQQRRAQLLAGMEEVMGEMPDDEKRVPLDVRILESAQHPQFTRERLSFATESENCIEAHLLRPRAPRNEVGKTPAMLCLHPTTLLRKDEPAGLGGLENLHYAAELAARGFIALCPDYSLGQKFEPLEIELFDPYAHGYESASMKGIWNHRVALDLLQTLPEVDGARLGAIGHSLGGHNTLFLAAFDERVQVAVSSCGFSSWRKDGEDDVSRWSHSGYMPRIESVYGCDAAKMPFDFGELLATLAPRACFINAPQDDSFGVEGVRECAQEARAAYEEMDASDKLRAVYPPGGHDFPEAVREDAYQFIERWI